MFKIICVTNRKLCTTDFISRIKELYENNIDIILREKDMTEDEYTRLAQRVLAVCPDITLHTYIEAAKKLHVDKIHLPLHLLSESSGENFRTVGVSIHTADEAKRAEQMGASYVTAGHIFATDCKKGAQPRGLDFLETVKKSVKIPVYAIGGITPANIHLIKNAGADGACIMSGFMTCEDVGKYMQNKG